MTISNEVTERTAHAEDRTLAFASKLYYDLYHPDAGGGPRPLVIALHGYGANKRQMMRQARLMSPQGFAVASLQGFHQHMREPKEKGGPWSFGFGWGTSYHPEESIALHHRALLDLIAALTDEGVADAEKIFLLGFSQSCALNYRFAFTHTEVLRGVIGICGGLPGDWETSARYRRTEASVLHLAGEADELYPPARVLDYAGQLKTRARDVEMKSFPAGHLIVEAMREEVRTWLKARTTR